ncbi:MAG: RHS repeat-associated core domain-containing protein [Bacillota bacterium]|nr:RHS repeat-associated core domain-containing protein [Bacillota bacterium]
MYYLQSRYYDPMTCRFLNADGQIKSTNLFFYCGNNPLNRIDKDGKDYITNPWHGCSDWTIGAIRNSGLCCKPGANMCQFMGYFRSSDHPDFIVARFATGTLDGSITEYSDYYLIYKDITIWQYYAQSKPYHSLLEVINYLDIWSGGLVGSTTTIEWVNKAVELVSDGIYILNKALPRNSPRETYISDQINLATLSGNVNRFEDMGMYWNVVTIVFAVRVFYVNNNGNYIFNDNTYTAYWSFSF